MNVSLTDCGHDLTDPGYDGLYAEGRSARAACEWIAAALTGDNDRAHALVTPELAELLDERSGGGAWPHFIAGRLPFTDADLWGVVSVEPAAVCVEMVTVVNFDKRVTDDHAFHWPGVALLMQYESDGWLASGLSIHRLDSSEKGYEH